YTTQLADSDVVFLPWKADPVSVGVSNELAVLPGNEWSQLDETHKDIFFKNEFTISTTADRMGYQLNGEKIPVQIKEELVSTGVSFGTVQLLPNGELIILMA